MKKKGFTLIELLAVIVILAIIALIATPLVLNTIDKAKKGAAKASALEYMNAVELYIVSSMVDTTKPQLKAGVEYQLSSKKYEVAAVADPNTVYINDLIEMKGDKPESGYLIVNNQGTVEEMEMVMNEYPVVCSNSKCEVTGDKEENNKEEEKTYSTGDVVQLTVGSDTSTKWYVLNVNNNDNTVKLLSKEYLMNNNGSSFTKHHLYQSDEAYDAAGDDKSSLTYDNSRVKTLVDNYGTTLNLGSNLKSIGLISIEDLQNIGCNVAENTCANIDSWIYDTGWTSTISDSATGSAWQIQSDGAILSKSPIADGLGISPYVRPVIVVSKDVIKAAEYQAYNVADAVTIDGVGYHVIKSSSSKDEHVTLLRDESIGEFAFDENGGTDYETSTLKTYLNSTYKDTFGDKKSLIKEITLLDFGNYSEDLENAITFDGNEEGTYTYLYKNYRELFFECFDTGGGKSCTYNEETGNYDICINKYSRRVDLFWTKSSPPGKSIITGIYEIMNYDEKTFMYYEIQFNDPLGANAESIAGNFMGGACPVFDSPVRPVITISKDAIN